MCRSSTLRIDLGFRDRISTFRTRHCGLGSVDGTQLLSRSLHSVCRMPCGRRGPQPIFVQQELSIL